MNDDLSERLEVLADADVWLLASPIYFGQISGQPMCCLDRWFSYLNYMTNPTPCCLAPGEQRVWVLTQAGPGNMYGEILGIFAGLLKWYGFKQKHLLRAAATGQNGDTDVSPDKIDQAQNLTRKVVHA